MSRRPCSSLLCGLREPVRDQDGESVRLGADPTATTKIPGKDLTDGEEDMKQPRNQTLRMLRSREQELEGRSWELSEM